MSSLVLSSVLLVPLYYCLRLCASDAFMPLHLTWQLAQALVTVDPSTCLSTSTQGLYFSHPSMWHYRQLSIPCCYSLIIWEVLLSNTSFGRLHALATPRLTTEVLYPLLSIQSTIKTRIENPRGDCSGSGRWGALTRLWDSLIVAMSWFQRFNLHCYSTG